MTSTDTSASGIHVVEGLARGQAIPFDIDSVTAFVAPTPRGPVDRAVQVTCLEDFQKIFDLPGSSCRLAGVLKDFFANGGTNAVVVRISGTDKRVRMRLPGPSGDLILEAKNPGVSEYLRAAVDYDGIDDSAYGLFNLVIQRLREPDSAWIDTQECFRRVSIEPTSRDYVGYVLNQSVLASLVDEAPQARPHSTCDSGSLEPPEYVLAEQSDIDQPRPTDYDLVGSEQNGTGLNALEQIPDIGQLCLLGGSEQGPGPVALLAADSFCRQHQAILIIEPPPHWCSVSDVVNDEIRLAFSSPNAVTWFPGLENSLTTRSSQRISAMGGVAASLAAINRPGVTTLSSGPVFLRTPHSRPSLQLDAADERRLKRLGINVITDANPLHYQLQGNVTLARSDDFTSHWQSLDVRCQALFILRRIRNATRWTFFHKSEPEIWQEIADQITTFLTELHACSILAGQSATQAFYVKCDRDTNQAHIGRSGEISFIVGFALRRPGEFLAFRLQRSHGGCRVVELGWESGLEQVFGHARAS